MIGCEPRSEKLPSRPSQGMTRGSSGEPGIADAREVLKARVFPPFRANGRLSARSRRRALAFGFPESRHSQRLPLCAEALNALAYGTQRDIYIALVIYKARCQTRV